MTAQEGHVQGFTIAQAAERLGVSQDTIRRQIRGGILTAAKQPRPQGFAWVVELPDDHPRVMRNHDVIELEKELARSQERVVGLCELLESARQELSVRRREAEDLLHKLENAYDRLYSLVAAQAEAGTEPAARSTTDLPSGAPHGWNLSA